MRILHRRRLKVISTGVAAAAVVVLLTAPRPFIRPMIRSFRPGFPSNTSTTITRTGPQGSITLHGSSNLSNSGNSITGTRSFNFNANLNGQTANFTATRTLTEQRISANALTARQTATLSETVNGKTASVSATRNVTEALSPSNSLTATRAMTLSETVNGKTASRTVNSTTTLTPAQLAALAVSERANHLDRAALRQADLQAAASPYSVPRYMSAGMPSYSALNAGGGYGGGGYGGGGAGYGSPGSFQISQMNTASSPAQEPLGEQTVNRFLAASGLTDDNGRLTWTLGLRILPGDNARGLRSQVETLMNQAREEAASGTLTGSLSQNLSTSIDALAKQLRRDHEERLSLTQHAYEEAEKYLATLKQAVSFLAEPAQPQSTR